MKPLGLNVAAAEFEMIDDQLHLFYNKETGEFDFYTDFMDSNDADSEKFEDDAWVAAPSQYEAYVESAKEWCEEHDIPYEECVT